MMLEFWKSLIICPMLVLMLSQAAQAAQAEAQPIESDKGSEDGIARGIEAMDAMHENGSSDPFVNF